MSFTSNLFFIGLLPWFILLIYLFRNKPIWRKILIIAANTVFYIWSGPAGFLVILEVTLVTWLFCKLCSRNKSRLLFAIGIVLIISPLLVYKYTAFAVENINAIFGCGLASPDLLMPVGISFFTFEAVSALCDVRKGTCPSFIELYMYLSFFPTVTSGPITRLNTFTEGLAACPDPADYSQAIALIVFGLVKKILIADKIAPLANMYFDGVANGNSYSFAGLWIGSIAYTLQLYFDFSGYSDIAIGIGRLMGFKLPLNFNYPYRASGIQDFWKRWHISLSQWFRDYIYIPLGGNRCSIPRHILNLLIVWLLTGIWHGADWSFIVWGLGYALLLLAEKYIPFFKQLSRHWYGHLYALFFINLLWIPFRADSLAVSGKFITGMFNFACGISLEEKALRFMPFLILALVLCSPIGAWIRGLYGIDGPLGSPNDDNSKEKVSVNRLLPMVKALILATLFILVLASMINSTYTPYIYGNF